MKPNMDLDGGVGVCGFNSFFSSGDSEGKGGLWGRTHMTKKAFFVSLVL